MANVVAVVSTSGRLPVYHDTTPKVKFQADVTFLGDGIFEQDSIETSPVNLTTSPDLKQILADEAKSLAFAGFAHTVTHAIVDGHLVIPN